VQGVSAPAREPPLATPSTGGPGHIRCYRFLSGPRILVASFSRQHRLPDHDGTSSVVEAARRTTKPPEATRSTVYATGTVAARTVAGTQ